MDSIKDLVREKMRIDEVIGSYITLVPFGKNYKACCPFHNEKTPSFNINTDKQMFYCFGCKKGGDIFSFVQEIERVDFKESLKILAEKAGVDLRQSAELSQEMRQKKAVLQIHEYTARFYQLLLSQQPNVLDYLKSRGMTIETIKNWRIGYAPDGFQQLITTLKNKGFSESDLIASGLVGKGDRGLYSRFRGRIMFPITDPHGKIIAFSGRLMPGTNEASRDGVGKYINSPETIIYHKSSALFGFSYAKKSIAEKQSVILVEGQFDAILLHQVGYTNTVALSGTACTQQHIEQLRRFATELIIATDSDRAGIQSAHKIAEIGYQFDCDVAVIALPQGKDPADIVLENAESWNGYMASKKDYITFHGDITEHLSLRDRIHGVEINLFPILARLQNYVQRDAKLQRIADHLKVSGESIRKEFQKYLETAHSQFMKSSTIQPKAVVITEASNPLMVQIQELSLIYSSFKSETGFWFVDHSETVELLQKYPVSISAEQASEILVRYQTLDSVAWKIRLDTLWLRIQQILIDTDISLLRQQIGTTDDYSIAESLQQKLLSLHQQKETLVRSLAE